MKFGLSNLLWLIVVVALAVTLIVQSFRAKSDFWEDAIHWNNLCQNLESVEVRSGDGKHIWTVDSEQSKKVLDWIKQNRDPSKQEIKLEGPFVPLYVVTVYLSDSVSVAFTIDRLDKTSRKEFEAIFISPAPSN